MEHKGLRHTLALTVGFFLTLASAASAAQVVGPPVPVDEFHPDRETPVEPAYGGSVVVHLSSVVEGLNRAVENSAVSRWMLYEIHDTLVHQDWETWEYTPSLADGWIAEDQLVLNEGANANYAAAQQIGKDDKQRWVIYGAATEDGDAYVVSGASKGNTLEGLRVAKSDVASIERETVFTFDLPTDRTWHDGHLFDAHDVLFSWDLYNNPDVDCDEIRFQFEKVLAGEVIDKETVRFFYEYQYFIALPSVGEMSILPRHLYDLTDPDNKQYDAERHKDVAADYEFTLEERGKYINENPHNTMFVGLGPYRVTGWSTQAIEAERYEDFHSWDGIGCYFDKITWRIISDDNTAYQALINGQLDYFDRVKSEDYFGERTATKAFTDNFYKGYMYTGTYGYTGWNTLRPQFSDPNVRRALALAFDMENYRLTSYNGLANRVSGPQNYWGPGYNKDVEPVPYNPDLAEELLAEAGWYDRDGDGWIDKDGLKFTIKFSYPSGNEASKTFGQKQQEAYKKLGIEMTMESLEWATFLERMLERNFDAVNLAWVPPLESDPEQLWHSKWGAKDKKSSNMCGVQDEEIDRLIELGQRELDIEKRAKIWQQLHQRVAELQPYMFGLNSPRKFAMNKDIRGHQGFKIAPGYSIRRWYYPAGTEGTRSTPLK
jgi:peptide/nickel transport system substrate-binding protein